jgi:hypothetical protein
MVITRNQTATEIPTLDPAAWGESHAGVPLPESETGGQCLFCHEETLEPNWNGNHHQLFIRPADASPEGIEAFAEAGVEQALLEEITHVMGGGRQHAYLRLAEANGEADLFGPRYNAEKKIAVQLTDAGWKPSVFNDTCASCHATGYDTTTGHFQSLSLDCMVCHGDLPMSHADNPTEALFSKTAATPPHVEISICGSCHIRSGVSKSTGKPYPNNYIPGDNLFIDLEVDWNTASLNKLNAADRHIVWNAREVVLYGNEEMTCTTCHDVHDQSTLRHQELEEQRYCFICHAGKDTRSGFQGNRVRSEVCGY